MKNIIAIWCAVLIGLSAAYTQELTQTVKGRIVDQQSKSAVIGVTVLIADSHPILGSTSDVDGYFRIVNVPVGRQTLLFSSIGYESKSLANIAVTTGKQVVLDVALIESLKELAAVEVIAARGEQGKPINDLATVSAISLSVEETSRYAATFDDPARAALTQAGVSTGGDDLLNEIVIRGNSPKGLLWRLEGVEVANPNHFASVGSSAGGVSMLSSSMLANSDFFTGAFPAQYGNATSGIFDLKMRKGNFDQHEHSFQAGLLGVAASSEGPLSKKSHASYLVNYRYSTLALFDNIGLSILGEKEAITFQDVAYKFHLPTKKMGSFSIWGLGGFNTYEYKEDPAIGDYFKEIEDQMMGVAGVSHVIYLNPDTFIESILSVSRQGNNSFYTADSTAVKQEDLEGFEWGEGSEEIVETAVRVSSFINHKINAKNMIRVGGIYSQLGYDLFNREYAYTEGQFLTFLNENGQNNFYQAFGQWQHRINKDWTVNSGFHVSHFAFNNKTYIEPRLGYRWQMTTKSALTGGAGLHSRMETIALYLAKETMEDGTTRQNNKDLSFTRAAHAVVGFEHMIKQNLRFKAEVYYQHLYDVPVWANDTTSDLWARSFSSINSYDGYTIIPLSNKGTGKNYGIELTLEKFFSNNYYFMSTASLYQSKYKGIDGVERNTTFNGNYIFNALGGKEFQLRNKYNSLSVNLRFIYAGGKRDAPILLSESRAEGETVRDFSKNYEEKLTDYSRVDLGVSFKRNKEKYASVISLNVQNVAGIKNVFGNYYNRFTDEVMTATQLGLFPNLSYKIEF
ncbi:MAG: hypothetical protein ACJA0X_000828 [Cyclobacteriaceae bacterium]|jgi:hypothetical protein